MGGEGREGDWECVGCKNRNYAFRSYCNRCKQSRLLVDTKTPSDSKWLPRLGDWVCSGCTNNNYASRDKCKKCGQPKELAAMPAIPMPGVSLASYSNYFARTALGLGLGPLPHNTTTSIPFASSWSADRFGSNSANQSVPVPKGWRNGDWMCICGFHNYSSRAQCKKCNTPLPPALGTKRLASDDPLQDWENKRLNLGNINDQKQMCQGSNQVVGTSGDSAPGSLPPYPSVSSVATPNWQASLQFPYQSTPPAILGKGAKHWRNGDWMCTLCENHNYASRSQCNRCKAQRDGGMQQVSQPLTAM